MISQYATLARLDGNAVMIITYGRDYCKVRYLGHRGRKIRNDEFVIETSKLKEF